MLMPKKVKYRKLQKGRLRGKATRGVNLDFGDYALQVLQTGFITTRQIESARVAMTRCIKRGGKVWTRIFPDKPITSKPAEVRMGKGKGSVEDWVAPVKAGRILFEMEGVNLELAKKALTLAAHKLPLKTKIVTRENYREANGY